MKLMHDIENDLAFTIPPEGGPDSQQLFRAMTERSLSLLEVKSTDHVVDLACGMGQDAQVIASTMAATYHLEASRPTHLQSNALQSVKPQPLGMALAVEPSERMIRFAQQQRRLTVSEKSQEIPTPPNSPDSAGKVFFLRALGEELPFSTASVDAVLCKGSLDHFMEPALTLEEIARVLRPGGRVVISLANYDSLSCRLGAMGDRVKRWLKNDFQPDPHPYYQPPPDHLTRFGYRSIRALPSGSLRLRRLEGLSLLWGFPPWGRLLAWLPDGMSAGLIKMGFLLAAWIPAWSDVIVIQAIKEG